MKKSIRALLLCAGLGKRLRPITLKKPKCLMELAERPILELWLKKLEKISCESTLINTHYLSEQVEDFLSSYRSKKMSIETTYEPKLLGTAGTLRKNLNFFRKSTCLLIHADNAMEDNLNFLIERHENRPEGCLLTMLTFNTNNPQNCGIVSLDSKGVVINFHEKIKNPPGNIANGAIYAFDYEFIEFFKTLNSNLTDFSIDILPKLLGKVFTCHTRANFIDIGTPENLKNAQNIWLNFSENGV